MDCICILKRCSRAQLSSFFTDLPVISDLGIVYRAQRMQRNAVSWERTQVFGKKKKKQKRSKCFAKHFLVVLKIMG